MTFYITVFAAHEQKIGEQHRNNVSFEYFTESAVHKDRPIPGPYP